MSQRWGSYRALNRQFEERRKRFVAGLSATKVDSVVGEHILLSRRRFRLWFWLIVATYLAVAVVLWLLVPRR